MALVLNMFILMVSLSWAVTASAKEDSTQQIKADSLRQLQELRTQNVKSLRDIDKAIETKIEDTHSTSIISEIDNLKADKHEHLLRQQFLDRLIFQIDTKFNGGDLRTFLVDHALVDMAKVDATSSASTNDGIWKFLRYSVEAIRRLPEQKENILAFLEGYMDRSVANPVSPEDFLASRNYSNGAKSESGHPLSRDEVGAIADRRLNITGQNATPAETH